MKRIFILLLGLTVLLSACFAPKPGEGATADGVSFTDARGHSVTVSGDDGVVACSGSFAQTWMLSGGRLAGTTSDSFEDGLVSSGEAADVGGVHEPNLEQILALQPKLVILSGDIPGHIKLYDSLSAAGIQTAYFSVETFDDYLAMLKIFTSVTGRSDLYDQNGLQVRAKIDAVIQKAKDIPSPKILLVRAGAGKVTARGSDTMAGTILKDLGCINIADTDNSLLDDLSMEVIIGEDPDFIFATVMGDEQKGQKALENSLQNNPAWNGLSAVKNNRYVLLPKDLFHQKPNDRWAESYEVLWDILYGT